MFQSLILISLLSLALADNRYPTSYPDANPAYEYTYNVYSQDPYNQHVSFNQDESRDGYNTHGEYSVILPDGRTQIVTYKVEGDSGFIADVRFEGEAKYSDFRPDYSQYKKPKPAPPVYSKPVYKEPAKPAYVPKPSKEYGPVRFNPFG